MGDTGWGITFVLVLATLITAFGSMVTLQVFKTRRLMMQLKAGAPEQTGQQAGN
jgi:hypothetical protein